MTMTTIEHRHVLIRNSNGDTVGKFDKKPPYELDLKEGYTVVPIKIPDDAADRSEALDQLSSEPVDWDDDLRFNR